MDDIPGVLLDFARAAQCSTCGYVELFALPNDKCLPELTPAEKERMAKFYESALQNGFIGTRSRG